ncbi:MAG: hypothetical protein IPI44_22120 [Sulfuritalea sp.]|nr:hypothetical protein [Sulfuritalea sp.]
MAIAFLGFFPTAFFWRDFAEKTATRNPNRELVALGLGEHTGRGLARVPGLGQPVAHLDRRSGAGGLTQVAQLLLAPGLLVFLFPWTGSDRTVAEGRLRRDPDRYRGRHGGSGVPEGLYTIDRVEFGIVVGVTP